MDFTIWNFPFDKFEAVDYQRRPCGNIGHKIRYVYKDIITAFDIETTNDPEIKQAYMYIWQWHFDGIGTVFGRTWGEFRRFAQQIKKHLYGMHLMVFVHNLSFEFQFLKGIYEFSNSEIFAIDKREILKCEMMNAFEFRCSYLLTNMSLGQFLEKMGVANQKLSGDEFDYSIQRYPWTELTDLEMEYCRNDVVGLVQGVKVLMESDGDNLYTLPFTSTGYVRRDAKKAMRHTFKGCASEIIQSFECFQMCREAFRGGNTHANRYFSERIMENVVSYDRKSSYPSELCNSLFPVRPFRKVKINNITDLERKIYVREKPLLFRCTLYNVDLRRLDWGCPYLPVSKMRRAVEVVKDNGRILRAAELDMTITDVDYKIIKEEYTFDHIDIYECYESGYGLLPKPLRENVIKYFVDKTELKGVKGQEVFYTKQKNKLNANYGMMAQNPTRAVLKFVEGLFETIPQTAEKMEKQFWKENNKDFLSYAWGVWTTANARYELEQGVKIAHDQGFFLYTDTDSVKGIGDFDFSVYNKEMTEKSIKNNAIAYTREGELQAMGVYEQEDTMSEFVTMGAKKYAYRLQKNGRLYITIAGVNKVKGAEELEEAGGLPAFRTGMIFRKGGGLQCTYNDGIRETVERDVGSILVTDNVYISDSEYTLGVAQDYAVLLDNLRRGYLY